MRYAINLCDWFGDLKEKSLTPQGLLLRNLLNREPEIVKCERTRIDGDSILVRADVSVEQWNAIVELLRTKFGRKKHNYRLYQSNTGRGSWKRV